MPAYRKKNQADPSPILTRKGRTGDGTWTPDQMKAVAKIACAVAMKGNALYASPTRFGSLVVKVYIDSEQYAETLNPGDDWDLLAEEIIEALYDLATVALVRRVFPAVSWEAPGATETPQRIPRVPRDKSAAPGASGEA
jgi:hypothetical protein